MVQVLRGIPLVWVLSLPASSEAPVPGSGFDRSLEDLERQRVITPQERRLLENGSGALPIPASAGLEDACRTGVLSQLECRTGMTRRRGVNRRSPTVTLLPSRRRTQPLQVPVAALLAGGGGGFRLESVFAVTPRPQSLQGNGDRQLLFPVIGQAFTSSNFGWRLHPVLGSWLMHAGRDLAAPEGTPVVAALSGTVVSSGLAGGYGIAVEVEHSSPLRRTLYGHLSEIYVKSGQRVRQGEVIGRVGSTGLSTGPHLHFELRTPSNAGWQAMDPGELDLGRILKPDDDPISQLVGQVLSSLRRPGSLSPTVPAG